ncbi:BamA/TamA family outer membrane protein [Hymenobacter sp. BT770]|uniref:translocation and assembly module lipoprotein TamL n=1 Tax=Hymenobacter sp. BT770 TaxID=2886942 RepID=UPI001D11A24F|nr:BamA/TamA family outer membrane protein [Hymenobacter sp. BT770]MCC3153748.1 outer membrane protein assembly factor [Hymenobacter sp. BT770]MDO3416882.1 BamA/TamA family outer membrane protein [Hymenobacter sp. BT770]
MRTLLRGGWRMLPQHQLPGGWRAWKPQFTFFVLLSSFLILSGCSGLRFIPEGQKLYTGSKVTIKTPEKITNQAALQTELESVVRPKPNGSILGLRPKLYFWGLGQGKTKGLGHFLADKFGEPPVLLKDVKISATEGLMTNRLYNNGFFKAGVSHEVKTQEKTAQVDYTATVGKVYTIQEIHFPERDTLVDAAIRGTQPGTLLKAGDAYNLNTFTAERVRIDNALKNQGYFYFTPDFLLFQVDSTLNNKVNVYLRVKSTAPARATRPYWLDVIKLNTNYVLTDTTRREPIRYRGYEYYPDEKVFKAKAITNAAFLYPDSLYRRKRRDQTISRLMSLNVFKFVEIRLKPAAAGDSAGRARLDADVLMSQLKKQSLRADLQMVTKNTGFTGPGLTLSYRNRSALRGGEQLLINATAIAETQTRAPTGAESRNNSGLTSTEFGINAQLVVPRILSPDLPLLDITLTNSDFQPHTTFGAGVRYITRTGFFSTSNFNFNYGYSWKTKITNEQELRPIDIEYSLVSTTPVFDSILTKRPFLRNSFEQQFILGSSYRYTYNQQVLEQRRQQIFFQGMAEVSGNVAGALSGAFGSSKDDKGRYTLFSQPFSQYTKFDLELREYYRISANPTSGNRIVARLQAGIGLPYGNSRSLPYLRQYGIGGPNSIRAFAPRELGPGTYKPALTTDQVISYYDQVGDLRLEGNLEYRQDLVPYLKGAVFVDAGNIWLMNSDPDRPGGEFKASSFLSQMAVGAGVGLRIDVQYFVIRFDYAIPLVAPYGTPTSTAGRLNLAIGYPF